jgi:DsbC/DsbD-like thiol-disulfide interchange protein
MTYRLLSAVAAVLVLAAVLAAVPAQAPSSSSSKVSPARETDTGHATFTTAATATRLRPGVRVTLYVDVTPKPNVHIYAPGEKENLPITLTLARDRAYRIGIPKLPPPQTYVFPPLKLTQLVYSTPFRIRQPVTIVNPPPTGPMTITGTIRYQACDDKVCFIPKSVDVSWVVGSR